MGKKLTQVSFLFVFATLLVVMAMRILPWITEISGFINGCIHFICLFSFSCLDSCLRIHIQQIKCKE